MAAYITVGAKTSHGGTVITGSPHTTHNGIPVARKGDQVMCKKCKKMTVIVSGDASFIVDGAPIARGGDVTSCGAKLIANQQAFAESDFSVGSIVQAAPLVFPKSEPDNLFTEKTKDELTPTKIQLLNEKTQEPLTGLKYTLSFKDGSVEEGLTDSYGYTLEFSNSNKEIVNIEYPNFKDFGDIIKNYI